MKKLSLVAIATVLAAPAFAQQVAVPVSVNTSASNGVNVGSVTNLGLTNIGLVNQNVGVGAGIEMNNISNGAYDQRTAASNVTMGTHAFSVGSIVDSGNGGDGGRVNVIAVSAAVAASDTDARQAGLAGGLAVPVALAGFGHNSADADARLTTAQANLSLQNSAALAGSSQEGIGTGANGGEGKAFMITVNSNNTHIDNTSMSKIAVATNVNIADHGGVADGLRIDDSFNPVTIEDSLNDNAVAYQGLAATLNHNF